jgi:hypothetical protein
LEGVIKKFSSSPEKCFIIFFLENDEKEFAWLYLVINHDKLGIAFYLQ